MGGNASGNRPPAPEVLSAMRGGSRLRFRCPRAVISVGVVLVAIGAVGIAFDVNPRTTGFGYETDFGLEMVGLMVGVIGFLDRERIESLETASRPRVDYAPDRMMYITRDLLTILLDRASEAEPNRISIGLSVTAANRVLDSDDVPEETPVFTHLYLPDRPNSVSSVFGVDLQTPSGRTAGRFVSHPRSELRLTKRDDLHEVVFVAVPPWDESSVAAFDRRGRRYPLTVVDGAPPTGSLPGKNR